MPTDAPPVFISDRDITFQCPACQGELVVDLEGVGLEVPCPHCQKLLTVPPPTPKIPPAFDLAGKSPKEIDKRLSELARQFKENRSQNTEIRGHINRATIELHRMQLRWKSLEERGAAMEAEMAALEQAITKK